MANPVNPVLTVCPASDCAQSVPGPGWRVRCIAAQSLGRRASRPVGRVLCTRLRGPAAIHLGLPLLAASCGLPASIGRAALKHSRRHRAPKNAEPS
jgi:hypothetical protein